MKVLVVEDEPTAARRLCRLLRLVAPSAIVEPPLERVDEAVERLRRGPAPDLILMDVKLADGDCFEIFDAVEVAAPIIFCTAFDRYALRAFEVHSIDYLLKPVTEAALAAAIGKLEVVERRYLERGYEARLKALVRDLDTARAGHGEQRLLVRRGKVIVPVAIDRVAYFRTEHRSVHLVTHAGERRGLEHSLDELERRLPVNRFRRANRQLLVSALAVARLESADGRLVLDLRPPCRTPMVVSRSRAPGFKAWLSRLPVHT